MTQLTVNLSSLAAQQAVLHAAREGRPVEEFVAGIVENQLADGLQSDLQWLATLSDADVLALSDIRLSGADDRRLSELLASSREGTLPANPPAELDRLMRLHDEAILKKAMGWAEAVRRKLRSPISS